MPAERDLLFPTDNTKEKIKLMQKTEISTHKKNPKLLSLSRRSLSGSITIETALVLPIFLFAMLSVMYLTDAIRISSKNTEELAERAYKCAKYAYLGDALIEDSSLSDAIDILNNGDDIIDLVLRYTIDIPFDLFNVYKPYAIDRVRVRAFTGYDNTRHGSHDDSAEEMVYVTEHGSVYHRSLGCSHLKLKIREVDYKDIPGERSSNGAKYYPCEFCCAGHENAPFTVFVTDDGNRYHSTLSCGALKRTIHEVPLSKAGLPPCKECGK